MRTKVVTLPTGQRVKFIHRDDMQKVKRNRASFNRAEVIPTTTLPVDGSGSQTCPCPMDGNDSEGDCGSCLCAHTNGIRTYGQGKSGFTVLQAPVAQLEAQYQKVSGGDNGTTEDMLVGNAGGPGGSPGLGIWLTGIAGNPIAIIEDHLDIDITDAPLVQYCHDQFYATALAWSVPDAFIQTWTSGSSWLSAMTPDPENGHFTPLSDVNIKGDYCLWTWGGWCWVSPSFLGSVQPQAFVTFSALQFNSAGFDSHGRHVSDVGNSWILIGGNSSIVASIVSKFPPKVSPTPSPVPSPVVVQPVNSNGPTLLQAQGAIASAFNTTKFPLISKQSASTLAQNALVKLW